MIQKNSTFPAIRILPMSMEDPDFTGKTIEQAQNDYFNGKLASSGIYRFPTKKMKADPGTLVLFQLNSHIVAAAILENTELFKKPSDGYYGAYVFLKSSIRTFRPINAEQFKKVFPGFTRFGNVVQNIPNESYSLLWKRMNG